MKMTRRNILILSVVGAVLIVLAWYFFALAPQRERLQKAEKDLKAQTEAVQAAQSKLAVLKADKANAGVNSSELMKLSKMIPPEKDTPSLLLQLQDAATSAGVEFMKITPAPVKADQGYTVLPLALQFETATRDGSFFDLGDFLYRMEKWAQLQENNTVSVGGRLVNVTSIELKEGEKKFPSLGASINANAFISEVASAPTAARPVPAPAGAAPAGGRR